MQYLANISWNGTVECTDIQYVLFTENGQFWCKNRKGKETWRKQFGLYSLRINQMCIVFYRRLLRANNIWDSEQNGWLHLAADSKFRRKYMVLLPRKHPHPLSFMFVTYLSLSDNHENNVFNSFHFVFIWNIMLNFYTFYLPLQLTISWWTESSDAV